MRRFFITLWAICVAATMLARILPRDGEAQTLWPVEAENVVRSEGLIDLRTVILGESFERRYSVYGDTLVARVNDGRTRDWFAVCGDSLLYLGSNDRSSLSHRTRGALYRIFSPERALAMEENDSLRRCRISVYDETGWTGSRLTIERGDTLLFAPEDTVAVTVCITTELRDSLTTEAGAFEAVTTLKRWYAEGFCFPLLEETSVVCEGILAYSAMIVCPPSAQESEPELSMQRSPIRMSRLYSYGKGEENSREPSLTLADLDVTYSQSERELCVSSSRGFFKAFLSDMQGRLWGRGDTILLDGIPEGWYLLTVITSEGTATEKLYISKRG